MTRKLLIAGNWKMNNTIEESVELVTGIIGHEHEEHKVDIVVAPPYIAIAPVCRALADSFLQVSAQNVYWEQSGAYTGEVSAGMIKEAGCKWVIVGHSERRQLFGETDETVNKRTIAALSAGLKVIVCVGETLEQREANETFDVLDRQVEGALKDVSKKDCSNLVIAYEPVWAIGTGKTATSDQADEAHARIRGKVKLLYTETIANATRILYGGSVKPGNAEELLGREHVDGALVGGASLKADDFNAIINAGMLALDS